MTCYRTADVPVRGGALRVGIWGPDEGPAVLAVHGVTANHLSWSLVANRLPRVRVVAPDLRGRGRSSELPGPWGMQTHADDLGAVVNSLVGGPVLMAGHSMGAFAVLATAQRYPTLAGEVLLVDGGLPLAGPVDLGPALQRLSMTFESRRAYQEFWRRHPALRDAWSRAIVEYVDYDLVGAEPHLHSCVSAAAVTEDSAALADAVEGLDRPLTLLTATRGLLDEPPGLYPADDVARWRSRLPALDATLLADLNHYTVLMSPRGASQVAAKIEELLVGSP